MEVYGSNDFEVSLKDDHSPLTLADRRANEVINKMLIPSNIPLLSEEGRIIPYEERKNWRRLWIIDPLDGTKEFIKRNDEFTVNIALIEDGHPILGVIFTPVYGDLYFGLSDTGSFFLHLSSDTAPINIIQAGTPLPLPREPRPYRVVASRSHRNPETEQWIVRHLEMHPHNELVSKGSSLKICMIAEGSADIYPRFGSTMEWDTAAGHAILVAAGGKITHTTNNDPLTYNKPNLLNPCFIASGITS